LKAQKLPNRTDSFADIQPYYYPNHVHDHNFAAVKRFKIRIKHNVTLLDPSPSPFPALNEDDVLDQMPSTERSRSFCFCVRVDPQSGISRKKTLKRAGSRYGQMTESSGLIASVSSIATTEAHGFRAEREFIDYAPLIFRYIRQQIIGIDHHDYISSIIPENEEDQLKVLDVKYGEGKSGAFFYFTWDSRFIVKTVTKTELNYLLSFLKDYVRHLEHNRNTVLSRIVGVHSCRFYHIKKHFVVMENVFVGDLQPNEMYDLKGSWVGRYTHYGVHSGKVMKDLDLKRYVIMDKSTRKKMLRQLDRDTAFLERNNVMDYSLLMGIYFMKIAFRESPLRPLRTLDSIDSDDSKQSQPVWNEQDFYGGVRASCIEGPGIYYFGLIDMMQKYSWRKKLETWWKHIVLRKDVEGISCVAPDLYRRRFMKYMRSIIISDHQYYRELQLRRDQFGEEHVTIYPPRKVLHQNMRDMQQRRRSCVPSIDLQHAGLKRCTFQNEEQAHNAGVSLQNWMEEETPTPVRLHSWNVSCSYSPGKPKKDFLGLRIHGRAEPESR